MRLLDVSYKMTLIKKAGMTDHRIQNVREKRKKKRSKTCIFGMSEWGLVSDCIACSFCTESKRLTLERCLER